MANNKKNERRKVIRNQLKKPVIALSDKISLMLAGFQLSDIVTTKNHSDDFNDTRAFFALGRLRLMAYIFAILVLLSYTIDIILLEPIQVKDMFYARIILSSSLLMLAFFCHKKFVALTLNYLLPIGFLLPIIFCVFTQLILADYLTSSDVVGYSYMPYLVIAMLALFPLTLGHSLVIIVLICVPIISIEFYLGNGMTFATFNKVWALLMFSTVTIWLQIGQLVMLLKLYRESTLDPLTGLINRRVLMKRLEKEIVEQKSFFILMFDLDKFKNINDTYGHLDGDLVLKTIAQVIKREIREKDIIARFGGEEFVAIVSDLSQDETMLIAERIRGACESEIIINKDGLVIDVTTSIGVTEHILSDTLEMTFNRADELLYQAKAKGRNRVVFG